MQVESQHVGGVEIGLRQSREKLIGGRVWSLVGFQRPAIDRIAEDWVVVVL